MSRPQLSKTFRLYRTTNLPFKTWPFSQHIVFECVAKILSTKENPDKIRLFLRIKPYLRIKRLSLCVVSN